MKTYDQLNTAEQERAIVEATNEVLRGIVEEGVRFNDKLNGDDLQARIDKAGEKAERLQTPWFWAEIIMEDEVCANSIKGMGQCRAEDALYAEAGEHVIRGIVEEPEYAAA